MIKRHKYTEEQRKFIRENVKGNSTAVITKKFNKKFNTHLKTSQIKSYLGNHGLTNGLDMTFKKGKKPWNKGLKGVVTGGKSTQFKKGHVPENHKPVGSERIDVDGYINIKTKEPSIWELKHRVVYEKHHGPIPEGMVILFLDQNRQNCNIDNLTLISKHQRLIINKQRLLQDNKDLNKTAVNIAKLQEKICKKKKRRKTNEKTY